jgi:hypothetical protein
LNRTDGGDIDRNVGSATRQQQAEHYQDWKAYQRLFHHVVSPLRISHLRINRLKISLGIRAARLREHMLLS